MILSEADSKRFYQIWWPLLKYVNSQQNIVENFPENPLVENVNLQDAIKIRNVMWNSPDLLDKFIQINPAQLAENDLELAASWRDRFSSQFVIIRHLKKYSVFLRCDEQPDAFGVLGIISPLHEIVGHSVPVMVETVLLPFENKIIYDGLIIPYSVSFGPGLRTRFNHVYRTAQELCRVKTALKFEDSVEEKMDAVAKGNQKVLLAFHKDLAASGLGDKKLEEHFEVVENFVKTYLLQSSPPCSLLNISVELLDQYFREQGKKANRVSFKRLVRFLYNSGRIDWEAEKVLVDYLKGL